MTETTDQGSLFSLRSVLIFVVVGVISFAALVVLSAFAPDLEDKDQAGLHAYSRSALGYNFAVELLRDTGHEVIISRDPNRLDYHPAGEVLILTPENSADEDKLKSLDTESGYPTLIVLPKRWGLRSFLNRRHQGKTSELELDDVRKLTNALSDTIGLRRIEPVDRVTAMGTSKPVVISEHLQIMSSGNIVPIISVEEGTLFGRIKGSDIFILSEPELLNTHGLAHIENARLAMMMMDELQDSEEDISLVFDTSLHGFERTRDLLRTLFEPPLLGATLFAVATGILIGWVAFLRFGRPRAEGPAVATGRQSLIDSTAGLFSQTSKEWSLASDYGALMRRLTLKELGYAEDLPEAQADALLKRLEIKRRASHPDLKSAPDPEGVKTSLQLVNFAKDYHAWKKELNDESD